MDEIYYRLVLSGGLGLTGLDWTALLALLIIGIVYLAAPALGYAPYQRGLLLASMWVLIGKMALAVLKMAILYFSAMESRTSGSGGGPPTPRSMGDLPTVIMLFSLLEAGLFILALILFVAGLSALRRGDGPRNFPPRSFPDE
jgi:hypothetical protein